MKKQRDKGLLKQNKKQHMKLNKKELLKNKQLMKLSK